MSKQIITPAKLDAFEAYLTENEKSPATREKYRRDVERFAGFADGRAVDKALVLAYKAELERDYAVASANSMLAALNAFFRFAGWTELCVKPFKRQKCAYCPEEKELTREEYARLIRAAERRRDTRLALLLQTICATGIRVSELQYITVEAARKGDATVSCKGKTRTIFLVSALRKKLLGYAKQRGIVSGVIFTTRNGRPLDRSNVWRQMKALCAAAGVSPGKVFPHNLRHLFARTFYAIEKDMAKLADILGHTNINTTRIYIVTTGAEHRKKLERMRLVS